MKTELSMAMGAGVLAMAMTACAQSPQTAAHGDEQIPITSPAPDAARYLTPEEIVREIDDPHTGDRWLLVRSRRSSGGPGRLVLADSHRDAPGSASGRIVSQADEARLIPVIRSGDRLIVEEHTAVVDAILEGRALQPSAAGAELNVQLMIGGKVVRAVALGPGRAALLAETGIRP